MTLGMHFAISYEQAMKLLKCKSDEDLVQMVEEEIEEASTEENSFGTDKAWATTGTSAAILGGWQMNGSLSVYSGRPFTLSAAGASVNMPGNRQTPDQVKDNVEILGHVGDAGT